MGLYWQLRAGWQWRPPQTKIPPVKKIWLWGWVLVLNSAPPSLPSLDVSKGALQYRNFLMGLLNIKESSVLNSTTSANTELRACMLQSNATVHNAAI